jgi:hypothetical protein
MPDTFLLTIIFIVLTTIIAAFVKGKSKDRCLVDLSGDEVNLEMAGGKIVWGRLVVESTGLELHYAQPNKDADGHQEYSYILYKSEFPKIQALILYHDKLDEKRKKIRQKEIQRTHHPNLIRRTKRKIRNFFATVRDAILEVVNLFIGQAKRVTPAGNLATGQDKYVNQMRDKLISLAPMAYEPLLEKNIGKKVVLEFLRNEKVEEHVGVLKDYTAEFIEILDVDYKKEGQESKKVDLVIPRSVGYVKHLAEDKLVRPWLA